MDDANDLNAVDRSGNPFPARYAAAIRAMNASVWRRFSKIVDQAERDDVIQHTLRRAKDFEGLNGEANNLPGLIWHIIPEVVANKLRKGDHKLNIVATDRSKLENVAAKRDVAEEIENRLSLVKIMRTLDARTQLILLLRYVQGVKPAEIALRVGISVENVYQIIHRALEQLREGQR